MYYKLMGFRRCHCMAYCCLNPRFCSVYLSTNIPSLNGCNTRLANDRYIAFPAYFIAVVASGFNHIDKSVGG